MQMNDFELRKQEATERYGRELESLQQEYAAARRAVRATKLQLAFWRKGERERALSRVEVSDKSYCERISKQIQAFFLALGAAFLCVSMRFSSFLIMILDVWWRLAAAIWT